MNFKQQALAAMAKYGFTVEQSGEVFTLYRDGKSTPISENSEEAIICGCMNSKSKLGEELRQLNEKDLRGFSWNAKSLINI